VGGTYDEDEFELIVEDVFDGITVFLVYIIVCSAFDEGVADEGVDWCG
jgi:hypothetical protein